MDFNTKKIYEGLYSLFEDELIEIGDYISFTENNLKTYSNKASNSFQTEDLCTKKCR